MITPERLAEIERRHQEKRGPYGCCPPHCDFCDRLTTLREAQQKLARYEDEDGANFHLQCMREREALQQRVEALEKALSDMLNVYQSMARDVETLYDDWAEQTERARAALRGGGAR